MNLTNFENLETTNHSSIVIADTGLHDSFPSHWHTYGEIICNCRDGNRFRINRTLYTLDSGDILIIWPNELHEIVDAPCSSYYILQFSNILLEHLYDMNRVYEYARRHHRVSSASFPTHAFNMNSVLSEIRRIYKSGDEFRETHCCIRLYEFVLQFYRFLIQEKPEVASEAVSSSAYQKVIATCDFLVKNLDKDTSLTFAADHAKMSTYYFSRVFRMYQGKSYVDWINSKKTEKAISLLSRSDMAITEIAMQAGFNSLSTFNRAFRTINGCTPSEYRNLYAKPDSPELL